MKAYLKPLTAFLPLSCAHHAQNKTSFQPTVNLSFDSESFFSTKCTQIKLPIRILRPKYGNVMLEVDVVECRNGGWRLQQKAYVRDDPKPESRPLEGNEGQEQCQKDVRWLQG